MFLCCRDVCLLIGIVICKVSFIWECICLVWFILENVVG